MASVILGFLIASQPGALQDRAVGNGALMADGPDLRGSPFQFARFITEQNRLPEPVFERAIDSPRGAASVPTSAQSLTNRIRR